MVTLMPSSIISFAAVAIAMRPEAHCRSTDMPATLVGKASAQQRLARDIAALRSLLEGRAHHHIVDLPRLDGSALERVRDRMPTQRLSLGVVERAAIGLADRRARGGDDDGFTHDGSPGACSLANPHPSRLRRATFSLREKGLLFPSPSGRRWPEGPDEGLFACAKIVSSTPSRIPEHLVVPEAKHFPAVARQVRVTESVAKAFCVLRAVSLDDQLSADTEKVDDIRADGNLSAKLDSVQTAITQKTPKAQLDVGRRSAHRSGARALVR